MGWKNLKEHYRIGHAVQVTDDGICIGSPYIHDLIVISLDGEIVKADDGRVNEDLRRYMAEFKADPEKLCQIVKSKDEFKVAIPVYTYDGGSIIEKKCEEAGWPNVTHDGEMMYENMFSTDKHKVIKWAKENAASGIKWRQEQVEELRARIADFEISISESRSYLAKLEADYPDKKEAKCSTR